MEPSGANGYSLGGGDPRTGHLDRNSLAPAAPLSEDLGSRGGSAHPLPSMPPRSPWHPLLCLGAQGPHVEHGQAPPVGLVPHGTIPPMGARPMALWGRGSKGITLRNTAHNKTGWYHQSRRSLETQLEAATQGKNERLRILTDGGLQKMGTFFYLKHSPGIYMHHCLI